MRISDLLSWEVVDEAGRSGGPVRDVRIRREAAADGADPAPFRIAGLVFGGGLLAHSWGFAEGRATGPALLRLMTARGVRQARFLPAAQVQSWGPDVIRMRGRIEDLPGLAEELRR